MNRKEFLKLVDKHLNGTATADEEALLEQVYEQLNADDTGWDDAEMKGLEVTEERILSRVKSGGSRFEGNNSFKWLKVAAMILLTGSISLLSYHFFETPETTLMIRKVASSGKVVRVLLPDSSVVWLNGASSITYPKSFPAGLREVKLNGEAFFDIVHRTKQPFIVRSPGLNTQVLGTSFNVKAYTSDGQTKITVLTGKVGVYPSGATASSSSNDAKNSIASTFVLPGETIVFDSRTGELIKGHSSPQEVTAWKDGRLIYKNTPLWEVAADLQRVHNVTIVLSPAIKNCPVYGTFDNKTPEQIIKLIAYSMNGEFSRSDNGYRLTGKECQ